MPIYGVHKLKKTILLVTFQQMEPKKRETKIYVTMEVVFQQ